MKDREQKRREEIDDDRRLARRLRLVSRVLVTEPVSGVVVRATTADTSLFGYGLRFEDPVPFAKGQTVHICFEDTCSRVDGKVAWSYIHGANLNVGLSRLPSTAGDLETHPISTLFLDHRRARSTGVLQFRREEASLAVYMEDGLPRSATSNQTVTGLARILYRLRRIAKSDVADVERTVTLTGKPEKVVIVEKQLVKPTELLSLMRVQAEETVSTLFGWEGGTFTFSPQDLKEADMPRMSLDPGRIVALGMRRISPALISPYVPPESVPLTRGVDPFHLSGKARLKEEELRILDLADGKKSVGEILKLVSPNPESAHRALGLLMGTILVEAGEEIVRSSDGLAKQRNSSQDIGAFIDEVDRYHSRLDQVTLYELLELEETASPPDVKRNFHRLARRFHPDQHLTAVPLEYGEKLHNLFTKIQEAYSVLSDEKRRTNYDRELGRYAGATREPKTRKRQAPSAEDIYRQGQMAYKDEDFEAAAESFKWAAKLSPTKSAYQFATAEALAKLPRRGKEAEEYFLKAVELAPYNVDYFVELARLYLASELPSRAESTLRRALELDPEHPGARKLLRKGI